MIRNCYILLLSLGLCAAAWGQGPRQEGLQPAPGGPRHPVPPSEGVPPLVDRLFDALDANGDGMVDRSEFETRVGQISRRLLRAMSMPAGRPERPREMPMVPAERGQRRFSQELDRIVADAVRRTLREELGRGGEHPPGIQEGPRERVTALLTIFDLNQDGVIETHETEQTLERLRGLDTNGDGRLDCSELERPQRGPRPGERRRPLFEQRDQDGDGQLSLEEFGGQPERFERLDADGDGYLTPEELERRPRRDRPR